MRRSYGSSINNNMPTLHPRNFLENHFLNLKYNLSLDEIEARLGCTKTIQFEREDVCMSCRGTGKLLYDRTCVACNGRGCLEVKRHLKVRIPAGVKNGDLLPIKNEGIYGANGVRGYLYIEIKVKDKSGSGTTVRDNVVGTGVTEQKKSSKEDCKIYAGRKIDNIVEKSNVRIMKNEITGEYHSVGSLLIPKNVGILSEQISNYIVHTKPMNITEFICFWIEKKQSKVTIPGCYIIYDEIEQKIYVGQAKNVYGRVKEHIDGRSLYSKNPQMIDKNLCKLRHSALIRIIPAFDAGFSDLNEMERVLIAAYDCIEPKGYNLTKGNG